MSKHSENTSNFVKETQEDVSQVWRQGKGWVNPTPSPLDQHIFNSEHHGKLSV